MSKIRLLKLRDSYVFGGNYNKAHWYFVGNNKKDGLYLRGITHLYRADRYRFSQVSNGTLIKAKVQTFDTPQGLKKTKIKVDSRGRALTESDIIANTVKNRGFKSWRKLR